VERWQDYRRFGLRISAGKTLDKRWKIWRFSRDVPARFSILKLRLGEMSVSFKA
jgi:hypothetical protein